MFNLTVECDEDNQTSKIYITDEQSEIVGKSVWDTRRKNYFTIAVELNGEFFTLVDTDEQKHLFIEPDLTEDTLVA